ncbi:MAG: glycosyltransferase family 4 protein [Candidatus Methanoperedens sp.]|nr:glycosyltransferase family 4 protein [Candidatus Methanoperedens sp.]
MKICFISKYPPIEGGISSSTYWLAKGLGERGHEVHIVTNALEVEDEYREKFDIDDPNFAPKNVFVHSTDPSPTMEANPNHIPFSKMYCEKLASLAIRTIEEHDIDIIDSWYLIPYCVSGFLAKSFTKIPQIVRHGGSDIGRLYPSPYLKDLLYKVMINSDVTITSPAMMKFFQNIEITPSKIEFMQKMPVDTQSFNPEVPTLDSWHNLTIQKYSINTPIIGFIGKITHHFDTKGLCTLLDACCSIKEDFQLLFVANGKKLNQFKQIVKNANLNDKTIFLDFIPPWQIPSILKACTCVVALEKENSPIYEYHIPSIPSEALAIGKCVLMSDSLHKKEPYCYLKNGKEVLVVDPNKTEEIRKTLMKLIENPDMAANIGSNGCRALMNYENFDGYLDKTIKIYESILNKEQAR